MTPWPQLFELSIGETTEVALPDGRHTVTLLDVTHTWELDGWIKDNPDHRTLRSAQIRVRVDGEDTVLIHRPYEMPRQVGGVQLYVETTKLWATACAIERLPIEKDVRFSAQPAGASWGPDLLQFPILNYRWRSASYNNTWGALVPYNLLYYHRGEDFGAIPDLLPVVAILDGTVVQSPVPRAQGSNSFVIRSPLGLTLRYAHMNIETIVRDLTAGTPVSTGQVLGKTGCTWNGHRSQWADPHLHVAFARHLPEGEVPVSPYPFLVEAYLRAYPDVIMPVAGGYSFAEAGIPVTLDATHTLVRPGHRVTAMRWKLHDGRVSSGPRVDVTYDRPGQYAETLVVTTEAEDGSSETHEARDFAHVRVYDPASDSDQAGIAFGWAYATPVRGVKPGTPVRVWNRLINTKAAVMIDYGDGSPVRDVAEEAEHIYATPGLYTVTLTAQEEGGPVTSKLGIEVMA